VEQVHPAPFKARRKEVAKDKQANAKTGDVVELADKDGGFYDPQTQFKVVRGQQVKLGKTIGTKTNTALVSGRLLVVGSEKSTSAKSVSAQTESDLPEDLPGRDAFIAAEMNFDAVKNFDFEKDKVAGVGAKTIEALNEYFKA
jgi:hypothetical protein